MDWLSFFSEVMVEFVLVLHYIVAWLSLCDYHGHGAGEFDLALGPELLEWRFHLRVRALRLCPDRGCG